jgi:S1-C subfamily serine protease
MSENILSQFSNQLADAVERAGQSLVTVDGRDSYAVTGVVVKPELVLTINHTLERDDNIHVHAVQGQLEASVHGRDHTTDLALLRVPGLNVPALSTSTARVGQFALMVGRPENGVMATMGIVSGVMQGPWQGMNFPHLLRTDATPMPGFSGGALIDSSGAMLGVINASLARGAGVAVPAEVALNAAQTLEQHGTVKRGYLGVSLQPVKAGSSAALMAISIEDDSPAAKAGLMIGDVLLKFNGQTLNHMEDLFTALNAGVVGQTVALEITRGGAPMTLSTTLTERPSSGERTEAQGRRGWGRGRR